MSPKGAPAPQFWYLGNDIVDLADPRGGGKAQDSRFLQRVFSESEREVILGAGDPDAVLWMHWAGKEAIYKSASKALGAPPVFHHPLFRVSGLTEGVGEGGREASETLSGEGRYQDLLFSLRIVRTPAFIHCVSWRRERTGEDPAFQEGIGQVPPGGQEWRGALRDRFSPREWGCVTHQGSALTRIAAREALSGALGVPEDSLEIGCGSGPPGRRIPKVFLGDSESPVDLSLSHHGRFQAWVFRVP